MVEITIGIILIVVSAWLVLITLGLDFPYNLVVHGLDWLATNTLQGLLIAALFFICGYFLLKKPRPEKEQAFVTRTASGEVRITKSAMMEMITRSMAGISGISNIRSRIKQTENGLMITVICHIEEGQKVEPISAKIQASVKQDVEFYSSLPVKEVKVLVRSGNLINPVLKR